MFGKSGNFFLVLTACVKICLPGIHGLLIRLLSFLRIVHNPQISIQVIDTKMQEREFKYF